MVFMRLQNSNLCDFFCALSIFYVTLRTQTALRKSGQGLCGWVRDNAEKLSLQRHIEKAFTRRSFLTT